MNLAPIANHLETEGLGVQGTSLFINFMPYECKKGILLRSPLIGTVINHEIPGYYKCEPVVVVRAPEYTAALTLMQDVMRSLVIYDRQLDDIHIKYLRPSTLPVSFPVSDGQFYEVQVRFEAVYDGESYGYAA
jgi:hypothetical protein